MQRDHNLVRATHINRNVCAQTPSTSVVQTGALTHVLHILKATAASLLHRLNSKPLTAAATAQEVCLGPRQLWSARVDTNTNILCRTGVLWVTLSGDSQDYMLRAGEAVNISSSAHMVISTFSDAAEFSVQKA